MAISFKPKIKLFGSGGALDDGTLAKNALNVGTVNTGSTGFSGTPSLTVPGSANNGSGGIYNPALSATAAQKMTGAVVNNPGSATGTAATATSTASATDPAGRVKADLDAGMGFAKEHIAEGSLGRLNDSRADEVNDLLALQKGQIGSPGISDPRAQQTNALLEMQQKQIAGMTDPRSKEANDLLAMQKQRLQGMTPEEQRAAFEQGQVGINRQMSSSLRHLGGLAAANGVRGGAAAGLQMGAVNAATAAQGDLQRKLVLDNLAQKNLAYDQYGNQLNNQQRITLDSRGQKMQATDQYGRTLGNQQATELGIQQYNKDQQGRAIDRYGNTLTQQQGVGLGIDQYNIGQQNKEKLGQLGAAFQYGGLIDSYRASDIAKEFGDKNIALSEKALEKLMGGGGTGSSKYDGQTSSSGQPVNAASYEALDKSGLPPEEIEKIKARPENKYAQKFGYATFSDLPEEYRSSEQGKKVLGEAASRSDVTLGAQTGEKKSRDEWLDEHPEVPADFLDKPHNLYAQKHGYATWQDLPDYLKNSEEGMKAMGETPGSTQGTVVCTEAARQGLFDFSTGLSSTARASMSLRKYRNYLLWGNPTVRLMQKSPKLAKFIAWGLRDTLLVLSEKPGAKWRGHIGAAIFHTLCFVAGKVRDRRKKKLLEAA
jgi:hypothetical protein